jgi:hypothetical protein
MSEQLGQFLVDLASDPQRMAAYLADPERVFEDAGLPADARAALRTRDTRVLASALTDEATRYAQNEDNLDMVKMPSRKRGTTKKKGGKKKGGGRKGGAKKGGAKKGGAKKGGRKKTGSKKR